MRANYTIESLIGRGGLGCVWKAEAQDGTIVAVKEPLVGEGPDRDQLYLEKLRIEADILEKLTGTGRSVISTPVANRPLYPLDGSVAGHVVQFIDVEGKPPRRLVLQFVEGTSMESKYRSNPLGSPEVEEYARILLSIIRDLHRYNILHRDISPHNLISTTTPKDPVLIDFGTAKEGYNQLSSSGLSEIVKEGYSPWELAYGSAVPSSDLYSVAATILFLYTGINPRGVISSKTSFQLDESHKGVQRIPDEKRRVLKKALSFYPADRFQTADDFLNAMVGAHVRIVSEPHLIISGRRFLVSGAMIIGKQHVCRDYCRGKGHFRPPDIPVNDPESYVGRHHAVVRLKNDGVWIEDLGSVNGTAIRRATSHSFEVLTPRREYKLVDGDTIALAFSPVKGAYMTGSYHTK